MVERQYRERRRRMKPFNSITILFLLIVFQVSAAVPNIPDDPQEAKRWYDRRVSEIEEISLKPRDAALPELGAMLRQLSRPKYRDSGERDDILKKLQSSIYEIPGYAEWFGREIERMTDKEVRGAFHHQRGWYFETLSHLPSPETVKVLGEQLFDERNPFEGIATDAAWVPSCYSAIIALHNLGLENPPVKTKYPDASDLRTWQLWYEQVRAGTRTFSFKGDKTIYSLSGPVRTALDPGEIRSSARRSPAEESGEASSETGPGSSKIPRIVALSLAILALILAARRAFPKKTA